MLLQVKVRRVRVVGLNRTKNDIVVEQVKGVLKATTLYEVVISHIHTFLNLISCMQEVYTRNYFTQEKF